MDPPADPMRIPQGNIQHECVQIPEFELEISVPKSSEESGVSETETIKCHFIEKKNLSFPKHTYKWPTFLQTRLKSLSKFTITS